MPNLDQLLPEITDPRRLQALESTGLLDSPPEKAFDGLTDLVAKLVSAPVSLVSLVDSDRQFFKSQCGLQEPWASKRETRLSHSFCKHVVATRESLVVNNAPEHPLVRKNLAVRDLGVVAYLGLPLFTPDDEVIGSLCAIDSRTRVWSQDDIDVMSVLANAVMNEIAVRMYIDRIQTFNENLQVSNENLEKDASNLKVLCARVASRGTRVPKAATVTPLRAANG
ncbi:MAG: GAF domain-containing protein [Rhodothermales bacterium]|nr:GAF domain-containing protein [Rhodothermales bacterium]